MWIKGRVFSARAAHELHDLHLAHRGAYSVERLQAYQEFCKRTSRARVLRTFVVLPLPALVVAIGMECIPLQSPRDGWRANYGAFTRHALIFFITCAGLCVQTKQLVPDLSLSTTRIVLISAATAVCSISFQLMIAALWVYPIPFGYTWGGAPYLTFVVLFFLMGVGPSQLRDKPGLFDELRKQLIVTVVMVTLPMVYPMYNAVYLRLGPWQQTLFVCVLPLMKFMLQSIVAWSTKHIVEYMPGIAVFSVEVFNALYLAKCMQSAGSMTTIALIMGFDAFESVLVYRTMKAETACLYQYMEKYDSIGNGFVDTLMATLQEPELLSRADLTIRVRSPIKLKLSPSRVRLLEDLVRKLSSFHQKIESPENAVSSVVGANTTALRPQLANSTPPKATVTQRGLSELKPGTEHASNTHRIVAASIVAPSLAETGNHHSTAISPHDSSQSSPPKASVQSIYHYKVHPSNQLTSSPDESPVRLDARTYTASAIDAASVSPRAMMMPNSGGALRLKSEDRAPTAQEKLEFVDHSLKILFQCEYHVLVEFVEAIVPMLYCIYVAVLTQLPSRSYYPETRSTDVGHTVINIFAYACLEIISFGALHFSLKWKFGFSPAYLLAFVLENQTLEFQARLLVWFTYVLEITLVHYGVDLSLTFRWLHGDWRGMESS